MSEKVYLVGEEGARKANSYEAMTNSWEEAERLLKDMGPQAEYKVVEVKPPYRGGKR